MSQTSAGKLDGGSNVIAVKLLRIGKKKLQTRFNNELSPISGHPVSVSPCWEMPNIQETEEYTILQSFGKMYVGESFSICLRLSNLSQNSTFETVQCFCQLQYSGTKNYPVLFNQEIINLEGNSHAMYGFSINVDRPDVYYLNIQATYRIRELPDPGTSKRLFKFDAKLPMESRSQLFRSENGFIAQSRVSNNTNGPIKLQNVEFKPGFNLKVTPLHENLCNLIFQPNEIRSFLYHLQETASLPNPAEIGKLQIVWQNGSGDIGTLYSQSVTHNLRHDRILSVVIDNRQRHYQLETPSIIRVKISNLSVNFYLEDVRIKLEEESMHSVVLSNINSLNIGRIGPNSYAIIELAMFPKVPGIQRLEGLKVFTGDKQREFPPCEIHVL